MLYSDVTMNGIIILLGSPPEFDSNTFLLNTLYTFVMEHRGLKLLLMRKLLSSQISFIADFTESAKMILCRLLDINVIKSFTQLWTLRTTIRINGQDMPIGASGKKYYVKATAFWLSLRPTSQEKCMPCTAHLGKKTWQGKSQALGVNSPQLFC